MTINTTSGTVRITCGGKPLDGPYLPPESDLAELGRVLAQRYATIKTKEGEETA